jgi:tryptophan synthase beta chain
MELIGQEVSEEAEIAIPDEVLEIYSLWRPTPLFVLGGSRTAIGTRSRIFYKYEASARLEVTSRTRRLRRPSTTSRKGRTRLSTETGAGQWGARSRSPAS